MQLNFLFLGKTKEAFLAQGIAEYLNRLKALTPATEVILKGAKPNEKNHAQAALVKAADGKKLLDSVGSGEKLVLFDLSGKNYSSEQWARWLQAQMDTGLRAVNFGLGGPLGLDSATLKRADLILSLGPVTLTHEMARLLILEQTYRALTIIKGWPYHK